MKFYNSKKIDTKDAIYNIIFGERSNGKTYAMLKLGLENYFKDGGQLAYVRRWKEDITGRRAARLYSGLIENNEVEKLSNGEFKGIHYYAGKFYLCNYTENGKPIYSDSDIIAFTFSLSDGEHDKSTSFPNIKTIVFDEFLTNRLYLNDEFVLFMNTVSTIVRRRTDVKIYMLGNTVSKYCPYFAEMGLDNIQTMKQGKIDVYHYGESKLTVAVEYCTSQKTKTELKENTYFAFNNPKLEMITGGAWELNIYPHLPVKYKPDDVLLRFFIEFSDNVYQGNVIGLTNGLFIYIHNKTTPIKDNNDIVYSLEPNTNLNYTKNLYNPHHKAGGKIANLFKLHKVFYQTNEVGDAVNNYLKICKGI